MTHEEAIEAAAEAIRVKWWEDDTDWNDCAQASIAAYLEARGAVLCSNDPIGLVKSGGLVRSDAVISLPDNTPVYAALSDNPKGDGK